MRISIEQGHENDIVIEKIFQQDIFTKSAYDKARYALNSIIERSKKLRENCKSFEDLYSFGQNIIAFSGGRGQGKTSAMLSFSDALKKDDESKKKFTESHIKEACFSVLPPIDPTCLEDKQDILSLILSRAYQYVIKLLAQKRENYKDTDFTEYQSNDLIIKFQTCLQSLNASKGKRQDNGIEDMSMLHEYSDAALLKQHFYELFNLILRLDKGLEFYDKSYIILQLDDTDFHIKRAYEILEDLRRYLSIPNVIILMATDTALLQKGVAQHYLEDFKLSISRPKQNISDEEVYRIAEKYLSKLLPPIHTIYLPHLDLCSKEFQEDMHLEYTLLPEDKPKDRFPKLKEQPDDKKSISDAERYSLQNFVLRFIYEKTHIVFVAPKTDFHSIIPTTLRGLFQLMRLLNLMKYPNLITKEQMDHSTDLVAALNEQIPVLLENLQLFEDYFINDWMPAKLAPEQNDFILELIDVPAVERNGFIYNKFYSILHKNNENDIVDTELNNVTYTDMMGILDSYLDVHTQQTAKFFVFAIRVYLTIEYNKTVLREKQKAVKSFKSEKLFAPNYFKTQNSFYWGKYQYIKVEENNKICLNNIKIAKNILQQYMKTKEFDQDLIEVIHNLLFPDFDERNRKLDIMYLLNLILSGSPYINKKNLNQTKIFKMQEFALAINNNFELQSEITNSLSETKVCLEQITWDVVQEFFTDIQKIIQAINPSVSGFDNEIMLSCISDKSSILSNLDKVILEKNKLPEFINNILTENSFKKKNEAKVLIDLINSAVSQLKETDSFQKPSDLLPDMKNLTIDILNQKYKKIYDLLTELTANEEHWQDKEQKIKELEELRDNIKKML